MDDRACADRPPTPAHTSPMRRTSVQIRPAGGIYPTPCQRTRREDGVKSHIQPIAFKPHTESLPTMSSKNSHGATPSPSSSARSLIAIALLYNTARLALAAVLCGLILLLSYAIDLSFPILGAVVLAVILSSPVSMIVLKPLRTRINQQADAIDARHATKRGLGEKPRGRPAG
jgi:hypothetical protein